MDANTDSRLFYDALPRLTSFATLSDPASYTPLPDDWVVGTSDIVGSTRAIADGKYKTVNMVGAAVISAQINASGGRSFPYVFGGDGAGFACAPDLAGAAGQALSAVRCWADAEFGLTLRVAQVPVADIRAAGTQVAVARYQAATGIDYAMFAGGGLSWAEAQMKAGGFGLPAAAPGTVPDLTGLSCRWSNIRARNGVILSIVVQPVASMPGRAFSQLCEDMVGIAQHLALGGHPVPPGAAITRWPPPGLTLEAHASRGDIPLAKRKRQLLFQTLLNWFFLRTKIPIGGFDPAHYTRTVALNADYRKFDDGLKMTLDCDPETRDHLRARLEQGVQDGVIRYGLFEQDEAMMTCIVPSHLQDDHMHFIDGAAGGYTRAAEQIK
ncbi:MAG: hypothetical protein ACI8R4_001498 [Paracoccaceae bacterium]|jgi:hypothetical protein